MFLDNFLIFKLRSTTEQMPALVFIQELRPNFRPKMTPKMLRHLSGVVMITVAGTFFLKI
jgi:hypothetical protein